MTRLQGTKELDALCWSCRAALGPMKTTQSPVLTLLSLAEITLLQRRPYSSKPSGQQLKRIEWRTGRRGIIGRGSSGQATTRLQPYNYDSRRDWPPASSNDFKLSTPISTFAAAAAATTTTTIKSLSALAASVARQDCYSSSPAGSCAPPTLKSNRGVSHRCHGNSAEAAHSSLSATPQWASSPKRSHAKTFSRGPFPASTNTTTFVTAATLSRAFHSHPPMSESSSPPAQHKPLVVGRTKPQPDTPSTSSAAATMSATSADKAVAPETKADDDAAAAAASAPPQQGQQSKKKEKAPKPPKAPKAAPAAAPLTPALIDLRVGHILRAIAHPNADSLYVSTIAMGDPEGTEHTEVDAETGKVVRTVCSGLNGLVPLAEMQDRRIVVVANLKPVNMRSIKSAAMVLAASPAAEEGADPHAPDRVVELVSPPPGSEAGDKVFFEGWTYGEGKGPEKQLNPKKKQWEAIQPGFYTTEDLVVAFDAGRTEVEGEAKGQLVVEGKGKCTVKTLKGAVVR